MHYAIKTIKGFAYSSEHNNTLFVYHNTVAPNDYVAMNETLMFNACNTRQCVNMTIFNDDETDPDESFSYALERTSNLHSNIDINPAQGQIIISG